MSRSAAAALAVAGLAPVLVFMAVRTAQASWKCEDINNNTIVVGEARYHTSTAADDAYANSYWDGGEELTLLAYPGAANTSATNLGFYAYGFHEDDSGSDCAAVTFELQLQRSNTAVPNGEGCPNSYTSSSYTLVVNSCSGSTSDIVHAGKLFGSNGLAQKTYWNAVVTVDGPELSRSDSGCFTVLNQNYCNLVDF